MRFDEALPVVLRLEYSVRVRSQKKLLVRVCGFISRHKTARKQRRPTICR
jgi:hypothetical protein